MAATLWLINKYWQNFWLSLRRKVILLSDSPAVFQRHLWSLPKCSVWCCLCAPLGTSFFCFVPVETYMTLLLVQHIPYVFPPHYFPFWTIPVQMKALFQSEINVVFQSYRGLIVRISLYIFGFKSCLIQDTECLNLCVYSRFTWLGVFFSYVPLLISCSLPVFLLGTGVAIVLGSVDMVLPHPCTADGWPFPGKWPFVNVNVCSGVEWGFSCWFFNHIFNWNML